MITRVLLELVSPALILLTGAWAPRAAGPAAEDDVPAGETRLEFPELAEGFLEANGLGALDGASFQDVLDGPAFVRCLLGSFDLRVPVRALKDGDQAEEVREAAETLVELQRVWTTWRDPALAEDEAWQDDWETLADWVSSWRTSRLRKLDGGADLFEALDAKDKVKEAAARLSERLHYDDETARAVGDRNVMVLAPNREGFLRICALGGLLDEESRPELWVDKLASRTTGWVGWTPVVALENIPLPVDLENPFRGVAMTERSSSGLAQHVADRGATLLLRKEFWRHGTHFFEQALATNLVIAAIGENDLHAGDWKIEYRYSGARTAPYTRFVPGGNPGGGVLPPRKAGLGVLSGNATQVSLYREGQGKDHFIECLREGQEEGAELAAKKRDHPLRESDVAHFVVESFEPVDKTVVTAPFLGAPAEGKKLPPKSFLDDYEDFFRAYRSGFLHWLQTEADDDEEQSRRKFATLIERHGDRPRGSPLDPIVEEVYGIPLSAPDGSTDSLEWRFLAWLEER